MDFDQKQIGSNTHFFQLQLNHDSSLFAKVLKSLKGFVQQAHNTSNIFFSIHILVQFNKTLLK